MKNMVMLKEFYIFIIYYCTKKKMTALYSTEFILWDQYKYLKDSNVVHQMLLFSNKSLYIL